MSDDDNKILFIANCFGCGTPAVSYCLGWMRSQKTTQQHGSFAFEAQCGYPTCGRPECQCRNCHNKQGAT